MRRRTIATTIATVLTAGALAACGSDPAPAPAEQAPPPAPATSAPAPTPAPSAVPTLARWLNVPCAPEGATAKTNSGGNLVCKKVGSDPGPEWHAVAP